MSGNNRLLIVGNPGVEHVGHHFLTAAGDLGLNARLLDVRRAWSANRWVNRLSHRLLRHRPAKLGTFDADVLSACREFRPQVMLVTGIIPPSAAVLAAVGRQGVWRANFVTDDPYNPRNGAGFFWPALREYDVIYSPRRDNMDDLRTHGCRRVEFMRFGYNPAQHFPEAPADERELARFLCDVAIIGGADADRLPLARALACTGLRLRLYGGYWDRTKELRPYHGGFLQATEFRKAVNAATVNICMVRRANRDGHAMRSLELAAMRGVMVAEDTPDHRELFGVPGENVVYFSDEASMVAAVTSLCAQPGRAAALANNVYRRITQTHRHTYTERLATVLHDCQAR